MQSPAATGNFPSRPQTPLLLGQLHCALRLANLVVCSLCAQPPALGALHAAPTQPFPAPPPSPGRASPSLPQLAPQNSARPSRGPPPKPGSLVQKLRRGTPRSWKSLRALHECPDLLLAGQQGHLLLPTSSPGVGRSRGLGHLLRGQGRALSELLGPRCLSLASGKQRARPQPDPRTPLRLLSFSLLPGSRTPAAFTSPYWIPIAWII